MIKQSQCLLLKLHTDTFLQPPNDNQIAGACRIHNFFHKPFSSFETLLSQMFVQFLTKLLNSATQLWYKKNRMQHHSPHQWSHGKQSNQSLWNARLNNLYWVFGNVILQGWYGFVNDDKLSLRNDKTNHLISVCHKTKYCGCQMTMYMWK